MSRDVDLLLADIADSCKDVENIVRGIGYESFVVNAEKVAAVERKLFVIGEAAARLPNHLRERNPQVPWRLIIGLRNILAHAYWQIDTHVLWDSATRSVPDLHRELTLLRR